MTCGQFRHILKKGYPFGGPWAPRLDLCPRREWTTQPNLPPHPSTDESNLEGGAIHNRHKVPGESQSGAGNSRPTGAIQTCQPLARPAHRVDDVLVIGRGLTVGAQPVGITSAPGVTSASRKAFRAGVLALRMTFIRMRPSECGPTFHGNGHDGLPPDAAPSDAGLRASNERFIDFDPPLEPILYPGSHCKPVSMQHGPRCLVAPQAPGCVATQGGEPVLRGRHPPGGFEPHRQRGARSGEQRPGGS